MTKQCLVCKKEFKVYKSNFNKAKYCSWNCSNFAHRKGEMKVCLFCKKSFYTRSWALKNDRGKYCSQKCSGLAHRNKIKTFCKICSKPIIKRADVGKKQGTFCSMKCAGIAHSKYMTGEGSPNWKGGRIIERGYVRLRISNKYLPEHRLVMEKHLGRKLSLNEQVHHKNGIKDDNRLENLELIIKKIHKGTVKCPHCLKEFAIK